MAENVGEQLDDINASEAHFNAVKEGGRRRALLEIQLGLRNAEDEIDEQNQRSEHLRSVVVVNRLDLYAKTLSA